MLALALERRRRDAEEFPSAEEATAELSGLELALLCQAKYGVMHDMAIKSVRVQSVRVAPQLGRAAHGGREGRRPIRTQNRPIRTGLNSKSAHSNGSLFKSADIGPVVFKSGDFLNDFSDDSDTRFRPISAIFRPKTAKNGQFSSLNNCVRKPTGLRHENLYLSAQTSAPPGMISSGMPLGPGLFRPG